MLAIRMFILILAMPFIVIAYVFIWGLVLPFIVAAAIMELAQITSEKHARTDLYFY